MPEPVAYQIVRQLQLNLQAIRTADGYYYDVDALAVKLDPNQDVEALVPAEGPRPYVLLEVLPLPYDFSEKGSVIVHWPMTVHWVGYADADQDEAILKTITRGSADVERVLAGDSTLGGLVGDTRVLLITPSIDGARVWLEIGVLVRHSRRYGEP